MPDDDVLYGPTTRLAIANFDVGGEPMPIGVIRSLAVVKAACARVNASIDPPVLDADVAEAIAAAAAEVVDARHGDQFPVDVFQTGSGTSTNMNMNEVLATLAGRRLGREVHPNDEVNASQSSNDTIPTAIRVAALLACRGRSSSACS